MKQRKLSEAHTPSTHTPPNSPVRTGVFTDEKTAEPCDRKPSLTLLQELQTSHLSCGWQVSLGDRKFAVKLSAVFDAKHIQRENLTIRALQQKGAAILGPEDLGTREITFNERLPALRLNENNFMKMGAQQLLLSPEEVPEEIVRRFGKNAVVTSWQSCQTVFEMVKHHHAELTIEDTRAAAADLLLALLFMHSDLSEELGPVGASTAHADVAAENCFLSRDEHTGRLRLLLGDFGMTRSSQNMNDDMTGLGHGSGRQPLQHPSLYTPYFLINGKATDAWAAGVVLGTIVCGAPLWTRVGFHDRYGRYHKGCPNFEWARKNGMGELIKSLARGRENSLALIQEDHAVVDLIAQLVPLEQVMHLQAKRPFMHRGHEMQDYAPNLAHLLQTHPCLQPEMRERVTDKSN